MSAARCRQGFKQHTFARIDIKPGRALCGVIQRIWKSRKITVTAQLSRRGGKRLECCFRGGCRGWVHKVHQLAIRRKSKIAAAPTGAVSPSPRKVERQAYIVFLWIYESIMRAGKPIAPRIRHSHHSLWWEFALKEPGEPSALYRACRHSRHVATSKTYSAVNSVRCKTRHKAELVGACSFA